MKLSILLFLFCLPAAAQVAPAATNDTPATKEQIEKLFEVMHIREQSHLMMDSMQKQMLAMSTQSIKVRYPQITAAELARANRISEETFKDLPLDAMLDDMIPIYQKHLTPADVDAMIAFYSSPTGQKLMQQMPQITQEAMQVSYKRMQKQIDRVLQRVDDSIKEDESKPQKASPEQKPDNKPN